MFQKLTDHNLKNTSLNNMLVGAFALVSIENIKVQKDTDESYMLFENNCSNDSFYEAHPDIRPLLSKHGVDFIPFNPNTDGHEAKWVIPLKLLDDKKKKSIIRVLSSGKFSSDYDYEEAGDCLNRAIIENDDLIQDLLPFECQISFGVVSSHESK